MVKIIHDVAFRVPNNRAGNRFIEDCRKWVNRDKYSRVLARPRNGTKSPSSQDTLKEGCKAFAVYLAHSPAKIRENYDLRDRNYVSKYKYDKDIRHHSEDYELLLRQKRERVDGLQILYKAAEEDKRVAKKRIVIWQTVAVFLAAYSIITNVYFLASN